MSVAVYHGFLWVAAAIGAGQLKSSATIEGGWITFYCIAFDALFIYGWLS